MDQDEAILDEIGKFKGQAGRLLHLRRQAARSLQGGRRRGSAIRVRYQ